MRVSARVETDLVCAAIRQRQKYPAIGAAPETAPSLRMRKPVQIREPSSSSARMHRHMPGNAPSSAVSLLVHAEVDVLRERPLVPD
jgi:hypothetical protein